MSTIEPLNILGINRSYMEQTNGKLRSGQTYLEILSDLLYLSIPETP